jgi:hypothetical protein
VDIAVVKVDGLAGHLHGLRLHLLLLDKTG